MPTFTTKLVGLQFRPPEVQEIVQGLEEGDNLELVREPTNPYDENAIRIIRDGEFLGFVAASKAINTASEIAPFLDQGYLYTCRVVEGGTSYSPALRIEIEADGATAPEPA